MRFKTFIYIMILSSTFCMKIFGQRAILFGIRDNEYARIGYRHSKNWYVIAEHSIFVTKLKNQVFNGYAGYRTLSHKIEYNTSLYGGVHYGGMYRMAGGIVELSYPILTNCNILAGLRPHYDTSYGYDTAYRFGLTFSFNKEISLRGEFTSYPEYRLCEKRIKTGLEFKVKGLQVNPEFSIPIEGNIENIRLIIGFKYELKF